MNKSTMKIEKEYVNETKKGYMNITSDIKIIKKSFHAKP